MPFDLGFGIVLAATLFFYLRLIIIQRQKVKHPPVQRQGKKNKKSEGYPLEQYSILSRNRRDWIIAGTGFLLVILGILLKAGAFQAPSVAYYWWTPTAIGIVACSWGFR